jgi:hypothetical protein
MARIETYPIDTKLEPNDRWIGTDQTGSETRNYTVDGVFSYIVDKSTGNITVNNPDEEDLTAVDFKLKFKDRDASGFRRGYKIIRADFDWASIPATHANSIWEIRYEFDLGGLAITLPDNVFLLFKGGYISNYSSITANFGKASLCLPNGFDGSGTIDPTFVFDVCFTQDDKDKLDGIQALATVSDLGYTASPTDGTVTNTGGVDSTIPVFTSTNAGLLEPLNTLTNKPVPVLADTLLIEDSEDSNNKKNIQIGDLPVQSGTTNLSYTPSSTDGTVVSDTGTDAILPAGSTVDASLMLPGDKTKLNSIATGAQVNVPADWNTIQNQPQVLERMGTTVPPISFVYPNIIPILTPGSTLFPLSMTALAQCKVANNGYAVGEWVQVEIGGSLSMTNILFETLTVRVSTTALPLVSAINNTIQPLSSAHWNLQLTFWGYQF